jgi:predicted NodU family carbamoyl transferase
VYVMGLCGAFSPANRDFVPRLPTWFYHDASAVLLRDGDVVAAVEQERLSRIKHTTRFAGDAMRACLEQAGVTMPAVDRIAFFYGEEYTDNQLYHQYMEHAELPLLRSRQLIVDRVHEALGVDVDPAIIEFVPHHLAHAYSAYPQSGFDDALVMVMDGNGEDASTSVYSGTGDRLELLATLGIPESLGHFYAASTELLGYRLFDEYKVMGLAPHGDPRTYRGVLEALYELRPQGDYTFDWTALREAMFRADYVPRRLNEPFTQQHKDFAAAIQETLEAIAWHVVSHWAGVARHRRLALAGGVAQNCTFNGRVLASGLFDDVFVHPAAHDAGSAMGAALKVHEDAGGIVPRARIRSVFWGPTLAPHDKVRQMLSAWTGFVTFERATDVTGAAAGLLADDKVVGWVQGRSEFGPRALGNRSILADPRPETNRDRVNRLVKKREGFRPFAPSVQMESLRDYFVYPAEAPGPDFMVFTVPVRDEVRHHLGAVTHVDGTARVHAVDRAVNERYWLLLERFEELTGVPVLLNTSFNNHAEPIVDSAEDALACFLTTDIDHLVLGDFIVSKCPYLLADLAVLVPSLHPSAVVVTEHMSVDMPRHFATFTYTAAKRIEIGAPTQQVLAQADGKTPLSALLDPSDARRDTALRDIERLWSERVLRLAPVGAGDAAG